MRRLLRRAIHTPARTHTHTKAYHASCPTTYNSFTRACTSPCNTLAPVRKLSLSSSTHPNTHPSPPTAVKRILREVKELHDPTDQYYAAPLEVGAHAHSPPVNPTVVTLLQTKQLLLPTSQDNLFEWHFTVRGPDDSDFAGGIYHGRILLPPEYPLKPPSIILLTPNGRFQVGTKICLTISAHHPEFWQPSWSSELSCGGELRERQMSCRHHI